VHDKAHWQLESIPNERRWIIGLVIAALVFLYLSIGSGIDNYKRFNKATAVASGQVVELQENDDGEGHQSESANYQFKVDGIDYDGSVGNQDESFAKGDPIQVYYPEFNHAQGDGPKFAFLIVLWAMWLIVVLMIVRERRRWKAFCRGVEKERAERQGTREGKADGV
jgi:hypothetical protein